MHLIRAITFCPEIILLQRMPHFIASIGMLKNQVMLFIGSFSNSLSADAITMPSSGYRSIFDAIPFRWIHLIAVLVVLLHVIFKLLEMLGRQKYIVSVSTLT